ncbi:MAG: hypothetical protein MJZ35_03815 [Bacteroidaceae bacterium]|nr:hypothetical protein [Bacteroidaceae bacterium]
MKKILFSLMLLLWVTAGMALPNQDENGYYLVSNLQELKDAVNATKDGNGKSTSKIKLTDNIYLNGMASTLCTTFAGEIDASYTVKNNSGEDVYLKHLIFSSTPGDEETRKKCSYLFSSLDGATIKNVAFYNIRVESSDRDNIGVIASMATNTTFEQVTLEKCSIFTDENNAGALAGQATSCKFYAVFVNSCSVTVDGVRAGGFVGYSENNKYCYGGSSLGTAVFADGNNATNAGWSGGIAGYSKNDSFFYMVNLALVGADQNFVGGYAGESEGSNFVRCQNSGAVLQIDEEDSDPDESFRALHQNMLKYISDHKSEWTLGDGVNQNTKLLACALNVAGDLEVKDILDLPTRPVTRVAGFIDIGLHLLNFEEVGTAVGVFENLELGASGLLDTAMAAEGVASTGAGLSMTAVCGIAAAVAVAVAATAIAIYIYNGDDEVGGICGKATGGFFEQCTNNATLSCRDDNCGGIVGLGKGVTINNCLNTGQIIWDEKVCSGSILGQAEANGSKKCKVTNCLSLTELQIVGTNDVSKGMDPASGNNYCIDRSIVWQDIVDWQKLSSGIVTYWLNNGIENREHGLTPWRQNIGSDSCPLLDTTHDIVTRDMFFDMEIGTVDQLREFAEMVNFGNVYTNAKLVADIDMTNEWWTPIGYDEWGHRFCGIFDGQGHTIKGLTYKSDERPAGLFGCVTTNAEIRNVIIGEGSEFSNSYEGAGAIVGRVHYDWTCGDVIIENCGSYANVSGKKHAGGILGRVSTGEESDGLKVYINNCFSHGIITAYDGNSGLISGYMKDHGYVTNCWSNAYLRRTEERNTWPYGCEYDINECFVGYNRKLNISNCFITDASTHIDRYSEYPLQSGVTDVTSDELAIGKVTYSLNKSNATNKKELIWQQNIGNDGSPTFGNKGLYHSRSRKVGNQYGTVCLPFRVQSNDKINYYDHKYNLDNIDSEGVTLGFKYEEDYIGQGQAVLYRVHDDSPSVCFECADQTWFEDKPQNTRFSEWDMFGTYEQMTLTEDSEPSSKEVYYLSGDMIHNARKTNIAPYHAYIIGPNIDTLKAAGAKAIQIVLEDEDGMTTALEMVGEDLVPAQHTGKAYSIMGTEVDESYRGIVIKNGKKVVK